MRSGWREGDGSSGRSGEDALVWEPPRWAHRKLWNTPTWSPGGSESLGGGGDGSAQRASVSGLLWSPAPPWLQHLRSSLSSPVRALGHLLAFACSPVCPVPLLIVVNVELATSLTARDALQAPGAQNASSGLSWLTAPFCSVGTEAAPQTPPPAPESLPGREEGPVRGLHS